MTCFGRSDLSWISACPSSGWLAVSVMAPGWPASERIQAAPSPPYRPNANGLSPTSVAGPDRLSVTSPLRYLRWLPYLSVARNTARVASEPSAEMAVSSTARARASPAGWADICIWATGRPTDEALDEQVGGGVRQALGQVHEKGRVSQAAV